MVRRSVGWRMTRKAARGLLTVAFAAAWSLVGCSTSEAEPPPYIGLTHQGGAATGGSGAAGDGAGALGAGGSGTAAAPQGGSAGSASGGFGGQGGEGPLGGAGGQGTAETVTLHTAAGAFFTPTMAVPLFTVHFGENHTTYLSVRVELDLLAGPWQPEVPDEGTPDRTEHILFGLFRDHQTSTDQKYLMGSAAVTFATKSPHFRMFGRTSIGQGYTTYTQWSQTYIWQQGSTYHLDCLLDGVEHIQRCELRLGGALEKALQGAVDYLDPAAHLSSGFYLQIGPPTMGDIETSPIDWTFSNLLVTATLAP